MYCYKCGGSIKNEANFCPYCGLKINNCEKSEKQSFMPLPDVTQGLKNNLSPILTVLRTGSNNTLPNVIILIFSMIMCLSIFFVPLFKIKLKDGYSSYNVQFGKDVGILWHDGTSRTARISDKVSDDVNMLTNAVLVFLIASIIASVVFTFLKFYKFSIFASVITVILPIIMQIRLNAVLEEGYQHYTFDRVAEPTAFFFVFMFFSIFVLILSIVNKRRSQKENAMIS